MSNLQEQIDYQVALVLQESVNGFNMRDFKNIDGYQNQWDYAAEHLEQLGKGTARAAFLLSNRFVLKMAMPTKDSFMKGIGQNEAELDLFTDPRMKPVLAKIYDYDDKNKRVMWLVVELVRPLGFREFKKKTGVSKDTIRGALKLFVNADYNAPGAVYEGEMDVDKWTAKLDELDDSDENNLANVEYYGDHLDRAEEALEALNNPFVQTIMELEDEFALNYADVARAEHWGKTADGRIVLLDYGYTEDVGDMYY